MKTLSILSVAIFAVSTAVLAQEETRELKLSAKGIRTLSITSGAGFLIVRGEGSEIRVSAVLRADGMSKSEFADFIQQNVRLSLDGQGDRAYLESEIDDRGLWGEYQMGIDLTVSVPKSIDLKINDGSGSVTISDMASEIDLTDGSGSITVHDCQGDLRIQDGSGTIEVAKIKGDVRIKDGSGSMVIGQIDGNLDITDGSGSIDISNVERDVRIRESGRGGVQITGVRGRVYRDDR